MVIEILQTGVVFTSASMIYMTSSRNGSIIKCDSKRSFYSEESDVTPEVGKPTQPKLPKLVEEETSIESFLESKIKVAREELFNYFEKSKNVYIDKSDQYFQTERAVFSTMSSLHDRREEFFPNALYVLTGGLFGSVLARKRNLFVRFLSPVAFGLISFRFFFPSTFANVFGYLDAAERKNLPDVHNKQVELINRAEDLVKKTSESADTSTKEISSFFEKAKKTFGDYTGLNVDQTIIDKKK